MGAAVHLRRRAGLLHAVVQLSLPETDDIHTGCLDELAAGGERHDRPRYPMYLLPALSNGCPDRRRSSDAISCPGDKLQGKHSIAMVVATAAVLVPQGWRAEQYILQLRGSSPPYDCDEFGGPTCCRLPLLAIGKDTADTQSLQ